MDNDNIGLLYDTFNEYLQKLIEVLQNDYYHRWQSRDVVLRSVAWDDSPTTDLDQYQYKAKLNNNYTYILRYIENLAGVGRGLSFFRQWILEQIWQEIVRINFLNHPTAPSDRPRQLRAQQQASNTLNDIARRCFGMQYFTPGRHDREIRALFPTQKSPYFRGFPIEWMTETFNVGCDERTVDNFGLMYIHEDATVSRVLEILCEIINDPRTKHKFGPYQLMDFFPPNATLIDSITPYGLLRRFRVIGMQSARRDNDDHHGIDLASPTEAFILLHVILQIILNTP